MPIPETLCHPFATAKIVIRPAACSVGDGLIVAARRRDAALCACGRRGERTEIVATATKAAMSSSF